MKKEYLDEDFLQTCMNINNHDVIIVKISINNVIYFFKIIITIKTKRNYSPNLQKTTHIKKNSNRTNS